MVDMRSEQLYDRITSVEIYEVWLTRSIGIEESFEWLNRNVEYCSGMHPRFIDHKYSDRHLFMNSVHRWGFSVQIQPGTSIATLVYLFKRPEDAFRFKLVWG